MVNLGNMYPTLVITATPSVVIEISRTLRSRDEDDPDEFRMDLRGKMNIGPSKRKPEQGLATELSEFSCQVEQLLGKLGTLPKSLWIAYQHNSTWRERQY